MFSEKPEFWLNVAIIGLLSPLSIWAAVDAMHCVLVPHRPAIEEVGAGGEEEEEEEEVGREGTEVTETATETTARERWDSTCTCNLTLAVCSSTAHE